jgi:hypothetical protein
MTSDSACGVTKFSRHTLRELPEKIIIAESAAAQRKICQVEEPSNEKIRLPEILTLFAFATVTS